MDFVGLTTTGASKRSDLLSRIAFPIVIIEEAAEVFEAHIIGCIS